mmetsp:Transcript_23382/g.49419  ORF Transcript_23382/g.49419 Transcript_23382/m.49419 type:complete len:136 (+) Transcript_23382:386-793(+)
MSGGSFLTSSDSNWDEDRITYDNAPPADGMMLGTFYNVKAGDWYELDITSAVKERGPMTICILGTHDDSVAYSSKDGLHSSEITLTLKEVVPLLTKGGEVVELYATDDATISLQEPGANFGTDKGSQDEFSRWDA